MEFITEYLQSIASLSSYSLNLVLQTITVEKIKRNTLLVEQGKHNKHMYVIKKGIVRAFVNENGEDKTISLWMENETFGDVYTYITGEVATKSYIAIEDLMVYKFDTEKFRALFDINHEICNLGRLFVENFIVRSKFECFFHSKASPKEKYQFLFENRKQLINRVKLKDLASYINITPETLSRIRKK
jgi:CRP-like cAMP-binding protein